MYKPDVPDQPVSGPVASGRGRRLFRNTVLNGLGVAATLALNFFLVPFTIRHLGPAGYGIWVLVLSFALSGGYFSLSDLGLQVSVVKTVSEAEARHDRHRTSEVLSSALVLLTAVAVAAVAALFVIGLVANRLFTVPPELHTSLRLLFWLLAGELAAGLPGLAFMGLLEGLQRYGAIRAIDLTRQIIYGLVVAAALLTGHGVVALGVALAVSTATGTIGYFSVARRFLPGLTISPRLVKRSTVRSLFSFGGWVFLAKVNSAVWNGMDPIILATLLTSSTLAGYDVASKIQGAVGVVLAFTSSALMPAASGFHAKGEVDRLRELLIRGTRYSVTLALPVVIGAGLLARSLIVHWVSPRFGFVAGATQLFLSLQLISATASVANTMLVGLGRVKAVTLYASVAAVVNLGVSIALAPRLGIRGVILGTLVGYGITAPLYIRLVLKELTMRFRDFAAGALLPMLPWAVVFGAVVQLTRSLYTPTSLIGDVAVCGPAFVLYVAGVGLFAMSRDERTMLLGFVRPTRGGRR